MAIDQQARQDKTYRSKQPLYRHWQYLCKKTLEQKIPMQKSWRKSYERFIKDVSEPLSSEPHDLVLFDAKHGYVWSNVSWLLRKRAVQVDDLEWLRYKGVRKEISVLSTEFGITLTQFRELQGQGWSLRKIEGYCQRLSIQQAHDKANAALKLRRASIAIPNPNA
jgi:hypothetical protein